MATPDLTRLLTGFQGKLLINPQSPFTPPLQGPAAPTLALGGASGSTPGDHRVAITFLYGGAVEGPLSSPNLINIPGNNFINVTCNGTAPTSVTGIGIYVTSTIDLTSFRRIAVQGVSGAYAFSKLIIATDANITNNLTPFPVLPLAGIYPFDGTQLGEIMDLVVLPRRRTHEIEGEETGPETIEVVDAGESWKFTCALRGVDPDVYARVMAVASSTGVPSGRPLCQYPGAATQAGAFLTQRNGFPFKALLVPVDITRLPSFLFSALIPVLDASARLTLQLDREGTFGAVFHCLRATASGNNALRVVQWGMVEDLGPT